jgi:signal transduction histidine kinase
MRSLSSRLLVLTVFFVMVAEVLIFVPSTARFRVTWLTEKLALGHLAILALDATPDKMVSEMLQEELLGHVGAYALSVRRGGARLILSSKMPPAVAESYILDDESRGQLVFNAFATLLRNESRVIRVVGASPREKTVSIELVIEEEPLRAAMLEFCSRIFWLSVVISLITATLVYLALQWLMVRPMGRITQSMIAFRGDPENPDRIIQPTGRRDEIGTAQRELADLQDRLRATLKQRAHLAALGTAVAKINHDLRGILASALLVSDRLAKVDDPEVRKITPTLFGSIERAVNLCSRTLDFVGQSQPAPRRNPFLLRQLIEDVENTIVLPDERTDTFHNRVGPAIDVNADREQMFRIFNNLIRNALEAGAHNVTVAARSNGRWTEIDISDDGPGLPVRAQEKIFEPFEGSTRAGGAGLGLAIARELVRGHGGELTLVNTCEKGTTFRIALPSA